MQTSRLVFPIGASRGAMMWLLLTTVVAIGCGDGGPAGATVQGTVTYEGKPLERGVVLFNPTDQEQSASRATIQSDGRYKLTVVPGEYKVVVNLFTETDSSLEPGDPGYQEPKSLLPGQYSSLMRTPLEFTVEDQPTEIDLPL